MGFVFVLDRLTGTPLFPVEERPVPKSEVPGENAWPTQPFPLKPPPLVRQAFTENDITDVTAGVAQILTDFFTRCAAEAYSRHTIWILLWLSPAPWAEGIGRALSFDRTPAIFFVNANELGAIGRFRAAARRSPENTGVNSKQGEYARFWMNNEWPCQKPPWGTLSAINVNTGEIAWRVPLGTVEGVSAKTGSPNLGGTIVANGLIFVRRDHGREVSRVLDEITGQELWSADLEASAHATPVTYLGKKNRETVRGNRSGRGRLLSRKALGHACGLRAT